MAMRSCPPRGRLHLVARSWLSMKPWVKAWLFFLNFVFLTAFAFDHAVAFWALVAYFASGVLLLPIMFWQRGLTRLLGVAHLIPWTPLLFYLGLRLVTDWAGPRVTWEGDSSLYAWALVLCARLVVCLGFDLLDLWRWLRGERFVLGSPEAVQAGASRPARSE